MAASYDGYGRLTSYARTNEATQAHAYNGMDDRVATTSGTGPTSETRRFIYDLDGRVIGEYGSNALDVKAEFIWLHPPASNDNQPFGGDDGIGGYAPLALVTPNAVTAAAEISWLHANHLGVPVLTLDASGNSVTRTGYNLPGFPGQSRTHADLYYNRYRDYDPVTGRYIQADPIGLGGGANPYAYAGNNPVTGVDPDGLNPVALGRGAVAAGEVAGQGLIWWCRSNIALCMRTIAPAAVRVSNACKAVSSALAGRKDGGDDCDAEYLEEMQYCSRKFGVDWDQYDRCRTWASYNLRLCKAGQPTKGWMKDVHLDGFEPPRPPFPKRRRRGGGL